MFDRAKFWRYARYTVLTVALLAAGFTLYLDFRVRSEFEGRRFALPARIYARPLVLHAGLRIAQIDVTRELQEAGYREGAREGESGWFLRDNDWLEVAVRPFVFWDGPQGPKRVRVVFDGGTVRAVQDAEGRDLPLARLEPLPIGGIYPANNQDRVLVRLAEVPKHLVEALVANEDRSFYSHHGFDLRGIARAAVNFVRLRGLQGGSTLTQQLVKNFFLSPERTLQRKITELMMAVLLEIHYEKDEILETYLNEIYLGQDRGRAGGGPRGEPEGLDGHLASPGLPRARAPAAAAGIRRSRPALRRPEGVHHARPARAGRGGAGARAQDRAIRQGEALRRSGARRRGRGHRHADGRGAGADRRARRA